MYEFIFILAMFICVVAFICNLFPVVRTCKKRKQKEGATGQRGYPPTAHTFVVLKDMTVYSFPSHEVLGVEFDTFVKTRPPRKYKIMGYTPSEEATARANADNWECYARKKEASK